MGGRFALSDDSHATDQVGLNYKKVLSFVESTGIDQVYCFVSHTDNSFDTSSVKSISLDDLKKHKFFA